MRILPLKYCWHGWCYDVGAKFNRKENNMTIRMSSTVQVGKESKDIRTMVLNSCLKNQARAGKYSAAL